MRKIFKLLTSKFFLVAILLLLELAIVPATLIWLSMQFPTVGTYVSAAFLIIDIVLVLYVINSDRIHFIFCNIDGVFELRSHN